MRYESWQQFCIGNPIGSLKRGAKGKYAKQYVPLQIEIEGKAREWRGGEAEEFHERVPSSAGSKGSRTRGCCTAGKCTAVPSTTISHLCPRSEQPHESSFLENTSREDNCSEPSSFRGATGEAVIS